MERSATALRSQEDEFAEGERAKTETVIVCVLQEKNDVSQSRQEVLNHRHEEYLTLTPNPHLTLRHAKVASDKAKVRD